MSTKRRLPLQDMAQRHPALRASVAEYYLAAACVCLDRHHRPSTDFTVELRPTSEITEVVWQSPDEDHRAAFANEIDTTEAGAYAAVLAAMELMTGMVALRRAEAGSGVDYYIGPPGAGRDDLEDFVRVEVSGTDRGTPDQIRRRLGAKIAQARRVPSNLPSAAGVVGFREQLILLTLMEAP